MDRVRRSIIAAAASILSLQAGAQTVTEVYRLARENDPKFRASQADFRASEQVLDQAKAGFGPTVRFDVEETATRQTVISSNNPIFGAGTTNFPTYTWTLSITQPLFRKDVIERLAQAKAIVRQASFSMLAAEQDLMQRTAAAYLGVLAARDSLDLARAEKEQLKRQADLAEGRLKSGLGTVTNLHDVQARYSVNQAREIDAENKLADAKEALREITGKQIEPLHSLAGLRPLGPDPQDVEQWVRTAFAQNMGLQARTEAVEVAAQELERVKAAYYPNLSVVANHNRRNSGSTLFGGGSNVETGEITLRLSVPVFEGGLTNAQSAEANFRLQKAREDREAESRAVERQTRAAYKAILGGVSMVEALGQSVGSQQSALEAKEAGVRSGVATLLVVLDAQRDLFLARRDHAQAKYDYLLNRLKLKQLAGSLSEADLTGLQAALK